MLLLLVVVVVVVLPLVDIVPSTARFRLLCRLEPLHPAVLLFSLRFNIVVAFMVSDNEDDEERSKLEVWRMVGVGGEVVVGSVG